MMRLEKDDIVVVRPPGEARFWLFLALLAAVLFLAFVAWRNDWNVDPADPGTAIRIALGLEDRKVPQRPVAPTAPACAPAGGKRAAAPRPPGSLIGARAAAGATGFQSPQSG